MQATTHILHNSNTLCAMLLCLCLSLSFAVSAADSPCDPDLPQKLSDPLAYTLRGDRCEGRYIQEVGSTILSVLSLTTAFADYDLQSGEALELEWATPQPQEVHLRAHDLRQNLYYRMDAIRPANAGSYHWPIDILAALKIPRRDLGVLAWTPYTFGQNEKELFLPLEVNQPGTTSQGRSYRVALWPGQELTEVYISLATLGADGNPQNFLKDGEILGYGYYPAQSPIKFELSGMTEPGVYYLEIGADLASGASVTLEYRFYYAG